MTQIKAILYDLDGVLVDACDWHYESLNRALDELCGFTISRDEHIRHYNGLPTKKKLEMLKSKEVIREDQFSKIWAKKQKLTIDIIKENAKIDVEKIELHKKIQGLNIVCACVTNSIRETAMLMLDKTGQIDYMKFVITNEDVQNPKPHPEGYIEAMTRLGVLPHETIVVEDSPKGLEAARSSSANVLNVKNSRDVTFDAIVNKIAKVSQESK